MAQPDGSDGEQRTPSVPLVAIVALIGSLAAWPQTAVAQARPAVHAVAANDDKFRGPLERLLTKSTTGHDQGWQLAAELGPAVAPMLWELHGKEKANMRRRIVLLAAALVADGGAGDSLWAAFEHGQQHDQLIGCLGLALGMHRIVERPVAEQPLQARAFWDSQKRRTEPPEIQITAALLACARLPGAAALPAAADSTLLARSTGSGVVASPGVVAAALYAGVPVPASALAPYLQFDAPPKFAELVWRGLLLGALRDRSAVPDAELVQQARRVFAMAGEPAARGAAALVLSRADASKAEGPPPPPPMLQLLASEPRAARTLARWLGAAPAPLDDDPARLAVEYALGHDVDTVLGERQLWGVVPAVRRHIALTLAWRLFATDAPQPIDEAMPGLPEWFFVQWASGARPTRNETIPGDPAVGTLLNQLAQLLREDRLPRAVARDLLEDVLWRWRCHPGLGLWEAEAALVRDLLLTGSLAGTKYSTVPMHERYLPAGFGGRGAEGALFEIGVELWDWWLSAPRLPIPSECRLR